MKRILSLLLCAAMLLTLAPMALAEEAPENIAPCGGDVSEADRGGNTASIFTLPSSPDGEALGEPVGATIGRPSEAAAESEERAIDNRPYDEAPIEPAETEEPLLGATSGTCGENLTWALNTRNGTLTISGTGKMTDWQFPSDVPWYSNRSSIKTVVINSGVTSIGNYAFYGCSSLTSITIPDSVTSIGYWAFEDCRSLTSITIPDGVTTIRDNVFSYCSSLTSITIPDSVTSIGVSAFYYCSSLVRLTIGNGLTSIGGWGLDGCSSLTSITIGCGVTSIGDREFVFCSSLTSIDVSENNPAYSSKDGVLFNKDKTELIYCPCGKTSVTIPDSVTSIRDYAFERCSSLTSITIPDSVTSIGSYAFYKCSSLTSITIPDSVASIGYRAFFNCSSLTSITIPDGVTSIGEYAFSGCSRLTNVTIPNSVTSIGKNAFSLCRSLTDVYYGGTEAQWKAISIGSYNESLLNATIHFSPLPQTKLGDVNGDGEVNGKDITLLRWYFAGGYDVTIEEAAADVNHDGKVNGKDITYLRRYLAGGYGITLE